jgi:hypothetical protein
VELGIAVAVPVLDRPRHPGRDDTGSLSLGYLSKIPVLQAPFPSQSEFSPCIIPFGGKAMAGRVASGPPFLELGSRWDIRAGVIPVGMWNSYCTYLL